VFLQFDHLLRPPPQGHLVYEPPSFLPCPPPHLIRSCLSSATLHILRILLLLFHRQAWTPPLSLSSFHQFQETRSKSNNVVDLFFKQTIHSIHQILFVHSLCLSLLITITYDMSFPNWVLIFASSGNAMIELFVFVLGFRQESSKLINLMYFKQTGVDLLVFLIMGVAVQSIFYRMGMAHRIIWFCCCIERFGRLTELFSFEEIVEAVCWGILPDAFCFIIWA
jgi:hypothetical protein